MFNQNSCLVKLWAEKKYYNNIEVPNLFNLQEEVELYIQSHFDTPSE